MEIHRLIIFCHSYMLYLLYCFIFLCKILCLVFITVILILHLMGICFTFQGLGLLRLDLLLFSLLLLFVLIFMFAFSRLLIDVLFHLGHLLDSGHFEFKVSNDIVDLLIVIAYFKLLMILFSRL